MRETVLRKVILYSRSRKTKTEPFELRISEVGFTILRSGQEPRLLRWNRIDSWDLQQRKRRVLLVLRGGGSVTPLLVPGWKVDDLNRVLREVKPAADVVDVSDVSLVEGVPGAADVSEVPPVPPACDVSEMPPAPPVPDVPPPIDFDLQHLKGPDQAPTPEIRLDLPSPSRIEPAMERPEMDLSLPPLPRADSAESLVEMDLTLPPLPPPTQPNGS